MRKNDSSYTRPAKSNKEQKSNQNKSDITVVLLAGNPGHRMKSYGLPLLQTIPSGEILMHHQINVINKCLPNSEIIISCSDYVNKIYKLKPSNVRIVENKSEDTNEVEEMRLCLNNITTDNVLFICSDMYFSEKCISDLVFEKSFIVYDTKNLINQDSIGVTVVNKKATIMSYGISNKWGRIFYTSKQDLKMLRNFCRNEKNEKLFIHEAINYLLERCNIYAFNHDSVMYRVESASDVREMVNHI